MRLGALLGETNKRPKLVLLTLKLPIIDHEFFADLFPPLDTVVGGLDPTHASGFDPTMTSSDLEVIEFPHEATIVRPSTPPSPEVPSPSSSPLTQSPTHSGPTTAEPPFFPCASARMRGAPLKYIKDHHVY